MKTTIMMMRSNIRRGQLFLNRGIIRSMSVSSAVSFRSLEFIQDPYPALKKLMKDDPVHYSKELDGWVVTRYEDVRTLLADTERLTADRIRPFLNHLEKKTTDPNEAKMFRALRETFQSWVVFNDPPDHTRLRKLMDKAFRKRVVEGLRSKIESASETLLEEAIQQGNAAGGKMELISGYANKLPARVIADLLGVPHEDMPKLVDWSNGIAAFVLVSRNDKEKYTNAAAALEHLRAYFKQHVEKKKQALNPNAEVEDVIDGMIRATEGSDQLTMDELIATAILLIFAGHETTTHLITNGMLILSRNKDQLEALRKDATLVPNCIEEILRYDGPSLANVRLASKDFEYNGKQIKQRDRFFLFSCSANRDDSVFENADTFDIKRPNAKRNLTFGFGKHFCIGAPLARLEGEIALRHLIQRLKTWDLDTADDKLVRSIVDNSVQPPWVDLIVTRGMKRLPITFQGM